MKTEKLQGTFSDTSYFLERIFNNTYNGIAILNLEGDWLKVNDSVCEIFGYSRRELFNMNIDNIIFREDLGVHEKKYESLIQGKIDKYRVKQRYFHKNGSVISILIYVSLVSYKEGRPHMIWQFTDVTNHQKSQNKLKMMLSVVKEQNERLTAFADIITHNLRSHSGNLSMLAEFLEEDFSLLNENENFVLLKKAIENLQETMAHLTQVAKIKEIDESETETLNLYDYVEKAIYNIKAIAKNTNTTIINDVDENFCVKGIPAYLDSIILNFLTNAIKYRSDKRPPKIKLTTDLQNDYIVLNIADNGLGIDLDKYGDKLFQMYKTFHCNEDAIGIGLFITKTHIESMGGKVIVTSEVDVGSEFSIYLKACKPK
ncbi:MULTISPECIES: sensor histidine kinase [Hwangdonia]|uniref:histidine kinase n=1 Tax=Hwangdonia seohaensis TaxID=1240727 RepID=A0ABW3RGL0_9FLAO|nr:PAS domain S-box protein [Hwangdonia seohaensis]